MSDFDNNNSGGGGIAGAGSGGPFGRPFRSVAGAGDPDDSDEDDDDLRQQQQRSGPRTLPGAGGLASFYSGRSVILLLLLLSLLLLSAPRRLLLSLFIINTRSHHPASSSSSSTHHRPAALGATTPFSTSPSFSSSTSPVAPPYNPADYRDPEKLRAGGGGAGPFKTFGFGRPVATSDEKMPLDPNNNNNNNNSNFQGGNSGAPGGVVDPAFKGDLDGDGDMDGDDPFEAYYLDKAKQRSERPIKSALSILLDVLGSWLGPALFLGAMFLTISLVSIEFMPSPQSPSSATAPAAGTAQASLQDPRKATFSATNVTSLFLDEFLAIGPRPLSSAGNFKARDLLYTKLSLLAREAADASKTFTSYPRAVVEIDSTVADFTGEWFRWNRVPLPGNALYSVQMNNVVAKVVGQCEADGGKDPASRAVNNMTTCPALLLSCHYDSVFGAAGAVDDGIGCGAMIGVYRELVYSTRLAHSVIFLFNNGEESRLLGSKSFVQHRWFPNVKAVINIDGAGSGGPAMVFRSSDLRMVGAFGRLAPFPHANVVGNDMFKTRLVMSDTDFTIYSQYLPGVDMAFYQNRRTYHTRFDTFDPNVHLPSMQQLGSNVLAVVAGIASGDDILGGKTPSLSGTPGLYWDEYRRFIISVPFIAAGIVTLILALLAAFLLYVGTFWQTNRVLSSLARRIGTDTSSNPSLLIAIAGVESVSAVPWYERFTKIMTGFLGVLLFPVALTAVIEAIRPYVFYTNIISWRVTNVSALVVGVAMGMLAIPALFLSLRKRHIRQQVRAAAEPKVTVESVTAHKVVEMILGDSIVESEADPEEVHLDRFASAQLDILMAICVLLPLAAIANFVHIGILYEVAVFAVCIILATVIDWFILSLVVSRLEVKQLQLVASTAPSPENIFAAEGEEAYLPAYTQPPLPVPVKHPAVPYLNLIRPYLYIYLAFLFPLPSMITTLKSLILAMETTVQEGTPTWAIPLLIGLVGMPALLSFWPCLTASTRGYYPHFVRRTVSTVFITILTTLPFIIAFTASGGLTKIPFHAMSPVKVYAQLELDADLNVVTAWTSFNKALIKRYVGRAAPESVLADFFPVADDTLCTVPDPKHPNGGEKNTYCNATVGAARYGATQLTGIEREDLGVVVDVVAGLTMRISNVVTFKAVRLGKEGMVAAERAQRQRQAAEKKIQAVKAAVAAAKAAKQAAKYKKTEVDNDPEGAAAGKKGKKSLDDVVVFGKKSGSGKKEAAPMAKDAGAAAAEEGGEAMGAKRAKKGAGATKAKKAKGEEAAAATSPSDEQTKDALRSAIAKAMPAAAAAEGAKGGAIGPSTDSSSPSSASSTSSTTLERRGAFGTLRTAALSATPSFAENSTTITTFRISVTLPGSRVCFIENPAAYLPTFPSAATTVDNTDATSAAAAASTVGAPGTTAPQPQQQQQHVPNTAAPDPALRRPFLLWPWRSLMLNDMNPTPDPTSLPLNITASPSTPATPANDVAAADSDHVVVAARALGDTVVFGVQVDRAAVDAAIAAGVAVGDATASGGLKRLRLVVGCTVDDLAVVSGLAKLGGDVFGKEGDWLVLTARGTRALRVVKTIYL